MRAGRLDTTIEISRVTMVDDGFGTLTPSAPTAVATLRAQVIDESTEEFIRGYGASTERLCIFRTRYAVDVEVGDIVSARGHTFDLKQIKEIGRRRGLELRCEAVG